jgi:hypothetical protein
MPVDILICPWNNTVTTNKCSTTDMGKQFVITWKTLRKTGGQTFLSWSIHTSAGHSQILFILGCIQSMLDGAQVYKSQLRQWEFSWTWRFTLYQIICNKPIITLIYLNVYHCLIPHNESKVQLQATQSSWSVWPKIPTWEVRYTTHPWHVTCRPTARLQTQKKQLNNSHY